MTSVTKRIAGDTMSDLSHGAAKVSPIAASPRSSYRFIKAPNNGALSVGGEKLAHPAFQQTYRSEDGD